MQRLAPGDAFRYFLDPISKEITTITKHLNYATISTSLAEASSAAALQTDYNYLLRFVRGTVMDKTGTIIKVRIPRETETSGYIDLFFSMHRSNIMAYCISKGTVGNGSIKDIRDFETVGDMDKSSIVFMRQRYGEVMDTIIYNP